MEQSMSWLNLYLVKATKVHHATLMLYMAYKALLWLTGGITSWGYSTGGILIYSHSFCD